MSQKPLDPQSLLPGLEWETRRQFERFAAELFKQYGLRVEVRSGRRTCAEQRSLYAQGRTTGGSIVTYADGCNSWHTLGRAVDAYIITAAGRRSTSQSDYEKAGRLWEADFGGVWGGDFQGFGPGGDAGHFEFHPGLKIAQVCPSPAACEAAVAQWGKSSRPLMGFAMVVLGAAAGLGSVWFLMRKGML